MSESRSYNLLCQRWLPVVWRRDAAEPKRPLIGIREALLRAHDIQCLSHTSPFIEFGLYRLLITIVLDAYIVAGQRPTIGKMRVMLDAGQFDASILDDYLKRYDNCFDLWASDTPFLQRKANDDKEKKPQAKAVVSMFAAIPSGTNVAHWHHYYEDEATFREDIAAQFLTTVSPFNFKVKPGEARTLAGDPPIYALVLGKYLFSTIVLNLPRPSGRITAQQEAENGPAWRTPLDLTKLPKVPTIAQGFTWPVRVLQLEKDGATVRRAVNQAAYKKPTDKAKGKGGNLYDAKYGWRDPNAGIQTTKDAVIYIKARVGVPVWRDAVPLFLVASEGEALRGDRRRSRPEVITNALRVMDAPQFRIAVYGMRKKGGGGGDVKVEEWFRSVLTLPTEVARDSRLSARAIDAFKVTQKVTDALQTALRMLRPPVKAKKGKRPALGRDVTGTLADFWEKLEPVLSRSYLDALGSNDPNAEEQLRNTIRKQARLAFTAATRPQHRTADGLFRIANASNWLEGRLARWLPEIQTRGEYMSNDDALIRYLYSLKHDDSGTIAALRRACGQRLAESRDCQDFASVSTRPTDFLAATLTAQYATDTIRRGQHHNEYLRRGSIGAAWARYCRKRDKDHDPAAFYRQRQEMLSRGQTAPRPPSIHERFRTLLDADLELDGTGELAYRLRGLVRMCVAADVPIDVIQLAYDLRGWRDESHYVQERWAKAFYGPPRAANQTQESEEPQSGDDPEQPEE